MPRNKKFNKKNAITIKLEHGKNPVEITKISHRRVNEPEETSIERFTIGLEEMKMDRDEEALAITKRMANSRNPSEIEDVEQIENKLNFEPHSLCCKRDTEGKTHRPPRFSSKRPSAEVLIEKTERESKQSLRAAAYEQREATFSFASQLEMRCQNTPRGSTSSTKSISRVWQ